MTDMPRPEPISGAELRRRRLQLVLLALLFMAPVIAAWVAWKYVGEHGIASTSNAGQLVVPARPLQAGGLQGADGAALPQNLLQGRWTYVILAPGGCGETCERQLLDTRQVRLSVNKDIPRVQRLLLLGSAPTAAALETLRTAHPELLIAVEPAQAAGALAAQVAAAALPVDGAHFVLVDPLGNLMMSYGPDVDLRGVLKDLRKLLKTSQIG